MGNPLARLLVEPQKNRTARSSCGIWVMRPAATMIPMASASSSVTTARHRIRLGAGIADQIPATVPAPKAE